MKETNMELTTADKNILIAALKNSIGPVLVDSNGIVADTKLAVGTVRNSFTKLKTRYNLELKLTSKPSAVAATRKRKQSPASGEPAGEHQMESPKPAKARKIATLKGGRQARAVAKGRSFSVRAKKPRQEGEQKALAWYDQAD